MNRYEHNCPSCRCANPVGPRQWMAAHLNPGPHPAGLTFYLSDVYLSYLRWTNQQEEDYPVLSQPKLTRWLRTQGVDMDNRGGKGNKLAGWHLA